MDLLKKTSLVILILFYLVAGVNHFRAPDMYLGIIPKYLPAKSLLNIVAGICEIAFALLLISSQTRRFGAWGIIMMLIAFIPVHIQMLIDAPFRLGSLTISPMVAWIRLVALQPLLIVWAWWYVKK